MFYFQKCSMSMSWQWLILVFKVMVYAIVMVLEDFSQVPKKFRFVIFRPLISNSNLHTLWASELIDNGNVCVVGRIRKHRLEHSMSFLLPLCAIQTPHSHPQYKSHSQGHWCPLVLVDHCYSMHLVAIPPPICIALFPICASPTFLTWVNSWTWFVSFLKSMKVQCLLWYS